MACLDEKNDSNNATQEAGDVILAASVCQNTRSGQDTPTEDELKCLRRVAGNTPASVWLVALFSGLERFCFYALQSPLQNYIQNPAAGLGPPGALGMGQAVATALNCLLEFICYITPIFAGVLADGRWGPYKTILISSGIYICGILVLVLTSIPQSLGAGAGLGGLVGAIFLIGLGVGGVKSSVAPFTADQAQGAGQHVVTIESGERVVVDHEVTVRRIYSIFYWITNLFSLSGLASTAMEKYLGFWTSYLLALGALSSGALILVLGRRQLYRRKPEASFRAKLLSALSCAIKGRFCIAAADPAFQLEHHGRVVPWDEQYVEDLRQALQVCRIWAIYPIVWLCYLQNTTNLISQAGQMMTYGIPNDAFPTLNPIFVLIVVPVLERWVYPFMQKSRVSARATVRISIGFGLTAASMALAAVVQQTIYNAPPCYNMPLQCPAALGGSKPNKASVMLQIPIHFTGALGEMLWSVAGS
ncbi:unnamed protein product [Zymoseptoria tritici ST99CH_1E4]|uniref:Peptide transporter PTR2 n=1 Tax=Zymoseptoria tritici ST99CH_1E4 TaxID=1276532 RepID=A0A2H1FKW2_ZYMTR|nr:unnamed protein product [Zymoseptoria tritici ST99CH_1E4]